MRSVERSLAARIAPSGLDPVFGLPSHALVAAALLLATLLAAARADATVVLVPPLPEMTEKSEVVVHGRVVDQTVTMDEGRVVTLTSLEVIEGMKGAKAGDVLTIAQLGGSLNGLVTTIPGTHRFELHDEVVFFGVRHRSWVIAFGIGVGVFDVVRDESGARVVEAFGDVVAARKAEDGSLKMEAPTPRGPLPLDDFKRDLRAWAAARPKLRPLQDTRTLRPLRAPSAERLAPAAPSAPAPGAQ